MPSFTIGSFSANYLTEQPYGYEGDARFGRTARKWLFDAILTAAQAQALISEYDTWRAARIQDVDTEVSGVVGTTVNLTCDSLIASVSALPCWFVKAPEFKDVGLSYKQASVELVDAAQAVEVVLREQEASREKGEPLHGTFGTYGLGTATLTLTRPTEGYQDGPELALMATGNHYLTGPLVTTKTRNIEGTTNAAGWTGVRSWYETIITTSPTAGTWFPIAPPSAEAEAIVDGGVKSTRYTVSVTLAEVR